METKREFWFLPFFTLLDIIRKLEPNDIIKVIKASDYLRATYQHINDSSTYKFVLDTRIDKNFNVAMSTRKIKHIFIDVNDIDTKNRASIILSLINMQPKIETLTLIDQACTPYRSIPFILKHKFEFLTKIAVHGSHSNREIHSISTLLSAAENVKELIYSNGNLDSIGLKSIKRLEILKLTNVVIESKNELEELFFRSRNTLKIMHIDSTSCCTTLSEAFILRFIYDRLILLQSLEELKIAGGNELCDHRCLEYPPLLKTLNIYITNHCFIKDMYITLKRVVVEKMTIDLRHCLHNVSEMPKLILHMRDRYINQIREHQPNLIITYDYRFHYD